jgi:hypothetical protein
LSQSEKRHNSGGLVVLREFLENLINFDFIFGSEVPGTFSGIKRAGSVDTDGVRGTRRLEGSRDRGGFERGGDELRVRESASEGAEYSK